MLPVVGWKPTLIFSSDSVGTADVLMMAILLTLLLFFHVVGALAFVPGVASLLKPHFPPPNKVMLVVLIVTFGPAALGYFLFPEYVNLLSSAILVILVAIGEHLWATRHNVAMELREEAKSNCF